MFSADRMETFPTTITEVTACIMYVCALSEIRSGYPHPPLLVNCYLSAHCKQSSFSLSTFLLVDQYFRLCCVNGDSLFITKRNKKKTKMRLVNNTQDSNVVPHHSTNWARSSLTLLSRREVVLSCWYGRSLYFLYF